MIRTFFSTQSTKAWVGGLIAAALLPVLELIASGGSLSFATVLAALAQGTLVAAGVWRAPNSRSPEALEAEQARMEQAVAEAFAAARRIPVPPMVRPTVDRLLEEAAKDFGGQVISGE